MTHEETKKIIRVLCASYPNWKPLDIKDTVEAWEMMLADYSYDDISVAVKSIVITDSSGFAPSIGRIVDEVHKLSRISHKSELTGMEAWSLVRNAIRNGCYNAESEFDKLPPIVQKAVGSGANIRAMAIDPNLNIGVEQSHFLKAYDRAVKDTEYEEKLPQEIKALLNGGGYNGNVGIGDKETLPAIGEQMAAGDGAGRT